MRQVFLDTETTGLTKADRIVEIACVEMVDRQLTGRVLHHYLNPGRPVHPEALKIHGLTDEFLVCKPAFISVAKEFLYFVEGAEVIAHNASFDSGMLDAELDRIGEWVQPVVMTDSLALARSLYPGKPNSLSALCKRLDVNDSGRSLHGALLDAELLAEVYIRMTRGQDTLAIGAAEGGPAELVLVDLSTFDLPVIAANDEELAAHNAILASMK